MSAGYTVEEFLADMLNAGIEGTFDFLYWSWGHLIANSILRLPIKGVCEYPFAKFTININIRVIYRGLKVQYN